MTVQLKEMVNHFLSQGIESQIEHIRKIERRRTIEKPARERKEKKKAAKALLSLRDKLHSLSEEEKKIIIEHIDKIKKGEA